MSSEERVRQPSREIRDFGSWFARRIRLLVIQVDALLEPLVAVPVRNLVRRRYERWERELAEAHRLVHEAHQGDNALHIQQAHEDLMAIVASEPARWWEIDRGEDPEEQR